MAVKTKPKATRAVIGFTGPPHRLIATGIVPQLTGGTFVPGTDLSAYIPKDRKPLRIRNKPRFDGVSVKLKLARNTPPGRYKAQIKAGSDTYECQIDVSEYERVSIRPAQLIFRGAPGARVKMATTLRNHGNVDVTLPKTAPVGIFDDAGIETAFASTYGKKIEDVNAFLSSFTSKLAEAHGGLMKLVVSEGAGKHPPGAVASLEISAEIPEGAKKGHRYHAVWNAGFANIAISVHAVK